MKDMSLLGSTQFDSTSPPEGTKNGKKLFPKANQASKSVKEPKKKSKTSKKKKSSKSKSAHKFKIDIKEVLEKQGVKTVEDIVVYSEENDDYPRNIIDPHSWNYFKTTCKQAAIEIPEMANQLIMFKNLIELYFSKNYTDEKLRKFKSLDRDLINEMMSIFDKKFDSDEDSDEDNLEFG